MNILFLPNNIASLPSITANAINKIEGVEAKSLVYSIHKYQTVNQETIILPNRFISLKNPFKWLYAQWDFTRQLKKWIKWADVFHYTWGPACKNGKDLKWIKKMKKPVFIEWVGSDIRDSEFLSGINPYYKQAFKNGYEYSLLESGQHKKNVEQHFYNVGAMPMCWPEMSLYLNTKLFPKYLPLMQRINIKEFSPEFPSIQNLRPLIVHSPSAKITKGSNIIIAEVEALKSELEFDFVLLHNKSREEVLAMMKKADIFIDQIIIGSHGMATLEAFAFGKPVMCYLIPQVFERGLPGECPIINTNPDNLREQLVKLITSPQMRYDIGRKSREYVEKYHDAEKISKQLLKTYSEALETRRKTNA
jgi:glycosyltransferase involved in cell wall biosynthesis